MTTNPSIPPRLVAFEKIETVIHADSALACKAVADEMAALIQKNNQQGKHTVLGLATGATPKKVYECLINLHRQQGLSFTRVYAINLDEYYPILPTDKQSYRWFMAQNFFQHIDIDPANCFIPDGSVAPDQIKATCAAYEQKIAALGGIDFQLLGIGRNGHIGFNEPGSHVESLTRLITLDHATRQDAAYEFGGLAHTPRKAITMGVGTILQARRIVLLAWGERKAAIVKEAVEGAVTEFIPASYLQGHHNVTMVLDESVAADLTRRKTPWLTDEVHWDVSMIKKAVTHLSISLGKSILKLTNNDYNQNGLSGLLALYGQAYDINIAVFNQLQHTITGWPGGKPGADDSLRPERALPAKKRVLIFSPHPDDDIISMGGTFQRLVDQGHEVHVAYQTSGNIAVADDEAFRFIAFIKDFHAAMQVHEQQANEWYQTAQEFLQTKQKGTKDSELLRQTKGLIRQGEAKNTCRFVGVEEQHIHFLNLPFYETGLVEKMPLGQNDIDIVAELIAKVQPHQVYAAGDLADPHGTHKVCLDAVLASLALLKHESYMQDCWLWLYKGAWAEWDIDQIEMAVPMSPDQVLKKRNGIFKHQSQKDGVVFQGADSREFWQRAEDRNRATAKLYHQLGLADYEAMEAFVRMAF